MLIYDVGMNNGDDARYYIAKGYNVIAIEANPDLCKLVGEQMRPEIESGKLKILNIAVAESAGLFDFHIDSNNDVRSSLRPITDRPSITIAVEAKPLSAIISEYGSPSFVKIDVEHYDDVVLRDLSKNEIKPDMISVEAHDFTILLRLWTMGYTEYRLVNGRTVHKDYKRARIRRLDGEVVKYTFPRHSAGPFGDDLHAAWMGIEGAASAWLLRNALYGPGWFDIHAR